MKKYKLLLLLLGIITISTYLISYRLKYPIKDNTENIETNLKKFVSKTELNADHLKIIHMIDLSNKKFVLFLIDNELSYAELVRGMNDRLRIKSTTARFVDFHSEIIATNTGKYLIIIGKDNDNKLAYIKTIISNKKVKIDIPSHNEYFIAYCPADTSDMLGSNITEYEFYDKNNNKLENVFKATI